MSFEPLVLQISLLFCLLYRSAPSSPTHHPLMPSDFALREVEAKFALPHTPPSQFSLPQSLFPPSAIHSSSSLPASPSRPHPTFPATPFKYFPLGIRSSSVEALAPEIARKRDLSHDASSPLAKKTRLTEDELETGRPEPTPATLLKPLHPMALSSIPGASSFAQPPAGVPFFQIPVVNPQSLPTFLPPGFVGGSAVAAPAQPSLQRENNHSPTSSSGEG